MALPHCRPFSLVGTPELTQQAVGILQQAIGSSADAWNPEPLERLCAQLPDAPASSLRSAARHALAGVWPMPAGSFLKWEQIADGDGDVYEDEGNDVDAVTRAVRTPRTPHGSLIWLVRSFA
ncbi:hypothetical protein GTV15_15195 [Streptomyces sp. SID7803]|nr:hypothetical protein [Streptomyces sp. SID7803]